MAICAHAGRELRPNVAGSLIFKAAARAGKAPQASGAHFSEANSQRA